MMLPYSKCGLTKLVNKVLNMSASVYSKDRLISPKISWILCLHVIKMSTHYLYTLLDLSHIQLIQV